MILLQMTKEPLEKEAESYISEEKGVASAAEALTGAKDILAESISDEADYRMLHPKADVPEGNADFCGQGSRGSSRFTKCIIHYEEPVNKAAGHRILALNRGENEKILTVKIAAPEDDILRYLEKQIITKDNPVTAPVLEEVIEDSYKRLIAPAIEREIRNELTEKAEDGAIRVFGKNLDAAAHAAAHCGQGGAGLGSGVPYRLQAGSGGCHRKSAGYHGDVSHSAHHGEEDPGGQEHCGKTHPQVPRFPDFPGKRHGVQGVGAGYRGSFERDPRAGFRM